MTKFKAGDKVKLKSGWKFCNGELICTVGELYPNVKAVWLTEAHDWVLETDIKISHDNQPQNNMNEFKVGDKVKLKQGGKFSNGEYTLVITELSDDIAYFKETEKDCDVDQLELVIVQEVL